MGEVIRQSFGIPGELEDVSIPSQESIYSVGRICARVTPEVTAGPDHGSKRLTQPELMLESSRMLGNGQRVPLALDPACTVRYAWADEATQAASVVGLFPGMIVGVKGRNGSGNKFVAEQLLLVRPRYLPAACAAAPCHESCRACAAPAHRDETRREPAAHPGSVRALHAQHGPGVRAVACVHDARRARPAGRGRLGRCAYLRSWAPLSAQRTRRSLPGSWTSCLPRCFGGTSGSGLRGCLSARQARLRSLCRAQTTSFTRTMRTPSRFSTNPTRHWACPRYVGVLTQRVRCLPNPSVFYVNELAIGVSTADVLGDLRREELVQRVQPGAKAASSEDTGTNSADARDPMMRLARHVLGQRSFYPIYPPSSASKLPLDLSHSRLCALDQVTPDLLLLPSARVKPFVRVVDSTMVVNCGCLALPSEPAKDSARAHPTAFIHMQVDAMPRDALYQGTHAADDELITHSLHSRARIDVIHTE